MERDHNYNVGLLRPEDGYVCKLQNYRQLAASVPLNQNSLNAWQYRTLVLEHGPFQTGCVDAEIETCHIQQHMGTRQAAALQV